MQTVFVVLAAGMMACWLGLAVLGPRRVDTANALAVLSYGVVLRSLSLVFALTPLLITMYALGAFLWKTPAMLNVGGVSFLILSGVAGLLLIEVTRVQIVLTAEGITRSSPWSGLATMKWSDVESVGYSSVNRWFIVAGAGRTIRVSQHLAGIGAFAEIVQRKVVAERWASAVAALAAVR